MIDGGRLLALDTQGAADTGLEGRGGGRREGR